MNFGAENEKLFSLQKNTQNEVFRFSLKLNPSLIWIFALKIKFVLVVRKRKGWNTQNPDSDDLNFPALYFYFCATTAWRAKLEFKKCGKIQIFRILIVSITILCIESLCFRFSCFMLNFGAFGATKACFLKCRADGQNAFPCVFLDALPNFPLALLKNKRRISSFPLLLPSLMLTSTVWMLQLQFLVAALFLGSICSIWLGRHIF